MENHWFSSSLVGLITYAMSPLFNKLFNHGELGLLAFVIYCAVGSLVYCMMLSTTTWNLPKKTMLTIHVVFFVLMVTSCYSFYVDKTEGNTDKKVRQKVLNLVSCGAFTLMSLSLSRLTGLGFEEGVSNFFLASLMVAVMQWNLKFVLDAAVFYYILISIQTCLDSEMENIQGGDIEEERVTLIQHEDMVEAGVTLMQNGDIKEARDTPIQKGDIEETGATLIKGHVLSHCKPNTGLSSLS